MLAALKNLSARTRRFASRLGTLRALGPGLGLLAALAGSGCGDEEPHYLPPLPDMSAGTAGLPCEVSKLLAARCNGCHGQPPAYAPMALVSYADLTAPSAVVPTQKIAERTLARMQSPKDPMPPGPTATVPASELVPLQTWLAAGTPMVTCRSAAQAPHPGTVQ